MADPLKIGVVGAGAIGATIARAVDCGEVPGRLVGICELDEARREALQASLGTRVPELDLDALCAAADVVVEAAAGSVAPTVVKAALTAGCDVLVMSVGGLLGHDELVDLARAGAAVLVISQDLDEIFEVATHIAVIHDGRLSKVYPASALDREKIGLLMGGMDTHREAAHAH